MKRKLHVRFLGGRRSAMASCYPTRRRQDADGHTWLRMRPPRQPCCYRDGASRGGVPPPRPNPPPWFAVVVAAVVPVPGLWAGLARCIGGAAERRVHPPPTGPTYGREHRA